MEWYLGVWKKYAEFDGRARRTEYWMFVLFNFLITSGLSLIDTGIAGALDSNVRVFGGLYGLAVLVPSLAVGVRRLHDTNRSGWLLLLWLIPIIGWIVLLVFFVEDGTPGQNAYGPDPKGRGGMGGMATAPAGWLADPSGRHQLRYWNGTTWTENVSDNGVTGVDRV